MNAIASNPGARRLYILSIVARRRIALSALGFNRLGDAPLPPTLLLGYARLPEASIRPGVRELAEAVRAVAPA